MQNGTSIMLGILVSPTFVHPQDNSYNKYRELLKAKEGDSMDFQTLTGCTIQDKFEEFHRNNPDVYEKFIKYANQVRDMGYSRYSAKQVIGRVRWHFQFEIKEKSDKYKINDAFTSRYARLFNEDFPSETAFFEFRRIRSE